jgi:hypothetical protein
MSVTSIPETVKIRLWGKAAGRCEYEGCNKPLWLDSLTRFEFNASYIAHIIADSPDGPRGHPTLSRELAQDITNLMLMCDEHHRLVDRADVVGHPVDRLKAMKAAHEQRIYTVSGIDVDKRSHILLYGANIGAHNSPVCYAEATRAMVPHRYPADPNPITLSLRNSSFEDRTGQFWNVESEHLRSMVTQQVQPRLRAAEIFHLSVFALAPQPLLILLGSLLSDIPAAEVFQLHREPRGWQWQDQPEDFQYVISEPEQVSGVPALVFALSATVNNERIHKVLGRDVAIWRVTVSAPNNDFLKSKRQAQEFRKQVRSLMDRIKARHGEDGAIHVFPAMPVALAVEFGRILMPKADLPLVVYDENKRTAGFAHAVDINPLDAGQGKAC